MVLAKGYAVNYKIQLLHFESLQRYGEIWSTQMTHCPTDLIQWNFYMIETESLRLAATQNHFDCCNLKMMSHVFWVFYLARKYILEIVPGVGTNREVRLVTFSFPSQNGRYSQRWVLAARHVCASDKNYWSWSIPLPAIDMQGMQYSNRKGSLKDLVTMPLTDANRLNFLMNIRCCCVMRTCTFINEQRDGGQTKAWLLKMPLWMYETRTMLSAHWDENANWLTVILNLNSTVVGLNGVNDFNQDLDTFNDLSSVLPLNEIKPNEESGNEYKNAVHLCSAIYRRRICWIVNILEKASHSVN